jgi:hypothetical protein
MAAEPILSIETGDSRIRSGTRLAETTTSAPRLETGVKSMFSVSLLLLTMTSFCSNPIDVMISVTGGCWFVVI